MLNKKQKKPFVCLNNESNKVSHWRLVVCSNTSIVLLKLTLDVVVSSVAQAFNALTEPILIMACEDSLICVDCHLLFFYFSLQQDMLQSCRV